MLPVNSNNASARKNVRSTKAKDGTIPRRKSLGPNHVLNGKEKESGGITSIPRKLINTMRRSLAPNDIPSLKEVMEKAAAAEKENRMDNNGKSMRFSFESDDSISEYWKMHENIDMDLSAIGGMILLHQYCYKQFIETKNAIYRDGANFFRTADIGCVFVGNHVPIRMVYLGMLNCETVEPWFRDYYSSRSIEEKDVQDEYKEDKYTEFDSIFDEIGRDAFDMMTHEMHMMENYCAMKFKRTTMKCYQRGVNYWRKASPLHLPRNYQLALLLAKKKDWNLEHIEKWFRFFYESNSWLGARSRDVYLKD